LEVSPDRYFLGQLESEQILIGRYKEVLYTAVGGLKATFLTDFLHTTVALILIIYFTLSILTNESVGRLGGLYDNVMATAGEKYIPGNYQRSLLTVKSEQAIIWGLILKFGNLALVVMVSFPTLSS
jgi:urea-proton symporter